MKNSKDLKEEMNVVFSKFHSLTGGNKEEMFDVFAMFKLKNMEEIKISFLTSDINWKEEGEVWENNGGDGEDGVWREYLESEKGVRVWKYSDQGLEEIEVREEYVKEKDLEYEGEEEGSYWKLKKRTRFSAPILLRKGGKFFVIYKWKDVNNTGRPAPVEQREKEIIFLCIPPKKEYPEVSLYLELLKDYQPIIYGGMLDPEEVWSSHNDSTNMGTDFSVFGFVGITEWGERIEGGSVEDGASITLEKLWRSREYKYLLVLSHSERYFPRQEGWEEDSTTLYRVK